jgi:hypothetical protein
MAYKPQLSALPAFMYHKYTGTSGSRKPPFSAHISEFDDTI